MGKMNFGLVSGILAAGFFGILAQASYIFPTSTSYQPYWSLYHSTPFQSHAPCKHEVSDDIVLEYRHALYGVSNVMYKKIAEITGGHFVYSPQTSYLSLAAMAEGSSGLARQQLFNFLHLPEDICRREAYYHLASTREHTDNDIVLARHRLFIADSSVHVNKEWEEIVKTYANIQTVSVPFKSNPVVEIEGLKKLFNAQLPNIDISGNSLLMESLDYAALWTSVFSDAVIEEGPFYNNQGEQLGVMEYMKVSKRANIGFVPSLNMKILDLPVGREGRYRVYFLISLSPKDNYEETLSKIENSIVFEAVSNLKLSLEPVEIVIPKIKITSEIDMRHISEEVGITALWTDPLATRNISEPAALPSAYTQRVSVTIDDAGVRPAVKEYQNFVPPHHYYPAKPAYSSYSSTLYGLPAYNLSELASFVANKPFMVGVFDSHSNVGLMYGSFSKIL